MDQRLLHSRYISGTAELLYHHPDRSLHRGGSFEYGPWQQVIRTVRSAIAVDIATFRRMFDVSLGTAIQSNTVRSRETTVRYLPGNGNKGGRGTKEHVSLESQESSLLVSMDGTSLLMVRRSLTT